MKTVVAAALLGFAASALAASPAPEVRFASEPGVEIAGTLHMPASAAPLPAAIIVAGTGPAERGGFEKLRGRLLAGGVAVLQYDKRGIGRSTGTFTDTLPAMEQDVAAALLFLRARAGVDPARVALIGLSQGAVAAPAVAAREPAVAAVVMLSGPVGPRGELFLGILRANLRSAGKNASEVDRTAAAVGAWMEARSRAAPAAELAQARRNAAAAFVALGFTPPQATGALAPLDTDVVLSMYEAAPDRALAAIRAPVLAIYGSADDVIAPGLSVAAAERALAANPDSLVAVIPGADHILAPASAANAPGDRMSPAAVDLVGDWLLRRLRARPAG